MQDTRSLKDQHPAVGTGLAGALVPLLKGGEKEQGQSKGVFDAMRTDMGYSEGKKKCGELKGRLRRVGPCGGLHRGNWSDRWDVM
jgi:hypothetical protein